MIAIQYADFNNNFFADSIFGGYIGTITRESGNPAFRHGWKIVEVYELCD